MLDPTRVALLSVVAFVVRLQLFLTSDEPTGWDGYSYVVQVERLVTEGRLHWPDASWVTYFLGALHFAIPSAIIAVKVGACLLAALCVPAAFRLGGLPLALWAAASPVLTHLAGDFAKNLGVVAPLLLVLAWKRNDSRVVLVLSVLAAAVAHRVGAALLVALALGALGGALLSKATSRRVLTLGAVAAVAFVALSALLPNLLHPADVDRLAGQLQREWSFTPWPYFSMRPTAWPERVELLLAWPALLWGGWRFVTTREDRVRLGARLLPLAVCVFPFWRTDTLDLGYRLALMAPVFVFSLPARPERSDLRWLLLVPLLFLARTGFEPTATPPYAAWRALIARIPRPLPTLLIAPQGFNFLYDHETSHESLAWSPEPTIDRTTTWRLAWGVPDGAWAELAGDLSPAPQRLSAEVVYVREDVWETFVTRARSDESLEPALADPRNPSRTRPRSLSRNH